MSRIALICFAITLVVSICAAASGAVFKQGSYVEVASGPLMDGSWKVGMKGPHQRRCYRLVLVGSIATRSETRCEQGGKPKKKWRPMLKLSSNANAETVEVDETSPRVRKMKLRIGPKHLRTIQVETVRLSNAVAQSAGLKRNFRFAAYSETGSFCVKRAILFDADHHKIGERRLRCRKDSP